MMFLHLILLGLDTVESSVAGTKVWDKQLKAEYKVAASALKELGLIK